MAEAETRLPPEVRLLLGVQLLTGAGLSVASPFLPLLVAELERPEFGSVELWAGAVVSAQALTSIVAAPLWGAVGDRYGHEKMLLRATVAAGVVLTAMSSVRGVIALVLLRALQGATSGTVAAVNAVAASVCSPASSGRAFGLLQSMRWVGLVVGPLVGGVLAGVAGVRTSLLVTGVVFLFVGGLVWAKLPRPPRAERERGRSRPGMLATLRSALGRGPLRRLHLLSACNEAAATSLLPIVPLFVLSLCPSAAEASVVLGIAIAARATASVVASYHSSTMVGVDRARMVVLATFGLLACYVPLALATAAWQVIGIFGVLGIAVGYLVPSIPVLIDQLVAREEIGSTFGINSSVTSLARAIAPLLSAAIGGAFGLRAALGSSALLCATTALLALSTWRHSRRRTS